MLKSYHIYNKTLNQLPKFNKLLINTINAHCYNVSQKDEVYRDALIKSDILIPDGISMVWTVKWLTGQRISKIAGADLFFYEMERLNLTEGKCFFLGSSDETLNKIKERLKKDYPKVKVQTYSQPYKPAFSDSENEFMVQTINSFQPDDLMIGMTAPKQEKRAYQHFIQLHLERVCCIGAVFDLRANVMER